MSVTIYGRPQCPQCDTTKSKFHRAKIAFEYLTLDDHVEALAEKFGTLPRTLPYIVVGEELFNFSQVDSLVQSLKEA